MSENTNVPRWRRFLGAGAGSTDAPRQNDAYGPSKWSMGVLNDKETIEVPGEHKNTSSDVHDNNNALQAPFFFLHRIAMSRLVCETFMRETPILLFLPALLSMSGEHQHLQRRRRQQQHQLRRKAIVQPVRFARLVRMKARRRQVMALSSWNLNLRTQEMTL
jgi:hypothetical protein